MGSEAIPDVEADFLAFLRQGVSSSALSDVLDALEYRNQTMTPDIRPAYTGAVVVGRAVPVLCTPCPPNAPKHYESSMCHVIDGLQANTVPVIRAREAHAASWGGMFSLAARARGACGMVVDGFVRDVAEMRGMDFPVFAAGVHMAASGGRLVVVGQDRPVLCGGVLVGPGDLVFGDEDGVVVIPRGIERRAVSLALGKVKGETAISEQLSRGATLKSQYYAQ
jgi:4-hydroxy-4-methyl-2-oxoglutarate aldolase